MQSKIIASIYEILYEIGSGGGGVVYLARHLRLNKHVVLKADKRGISANLEKLRREVDALKSLSHTYIPQVYDFISDEGNVYTVMDYIEGESFDKPLERGEHYSQPNVVKWMRQLLEAICYLHSRPPYGILHSDIKPANVMLTPSGDICLIDYNIALALGEDGAVAVGASRSYASPEHYGAEALAEATGRKTSVIDLDKTIAMSGSETTIIIDSSSSNTSSGKKILLDARSDVYSLGATIYHILSGLRPATKAHEVQPLSSKEFSVGLVNIITKAMNPDPELRYQTAAEMLFAINNIHKTDPRFIKHIRNRYIAGTVLSVMFLLGGLSTFTGLKRMEQTQSALAMAEYSSNALANGNTTLAINYALDAISLKKDIFTPSIQPQAQKAITHALGVYDLKDGYKPMELLELQSNPFSMVVSPNGEFAAVVHAYEVTLIELETAQIITKLPTIKSALADAEFASNNILVYAGENGICAYDTINKTQLWSGRPATEIAISSDGKTIGAVNKKDSEAIIYDIEGKQKSVISFIEKLQLVPENDTFGNPRDNLFALNHNGSLLASSFLDGSLDIFNISSGEVSAVQPASNATHFEGGFSGDHFAFSAIGVENKSVFAVIDTRNMAQTGGFKSDNPFGVIADNSGIYVSADNLVVKLDPVSGEQKEVAYCETDVIGFSRSENNFIVATKNNSFNIFDNNANLIDKYKIDQPCNFIGIADKFAIVGGRDSPNLRILQRKDSSLANVFKYDPTYFHNEARINIQKDRVMLFSYKGFQLYDINGKILRTISIPDAETVYDQQYSSLSGNLVVIYKNAMRIYSGQNGELLYEKTGLKSAFYAPYGVSILEQDGTVSLIDIDTCQQMNNAVTSGDFAAICGIVVDKTFLGNNELIGAAKTDDGFLFAISDGVSGAIFDGNGKERFQFKTNGKSEAFFVSNMVIISPQHGTPSAFNTKNGKKISDLEPDSFIAYATKKGDYIISEYVMADGTRFGVLLNSNCETIAKLQDLTGIMGDELIFDYKTGFIRKSPIYNINELIALAKGGK